MTESLSQIVSEISTSLGPEISLDSMSVARFVTHLRYLYVRIASDSQFANDPPLLLSAMHDAYPEVAGLAQRVRFLIESQRGKHTRLSSRTAPRARLPGLARGVVLAVSRSLIGVVQPFCVPQNPSGANNSATNSSSRPASLTRSSTV